MAEELRAQGACLAVAHALRHRLAAPEGWIADLRVSQRSAEHYESVETRILLAMLGGAPVAELIADKNRLRDQLGAQSPRVLALQTLSSR